MKKVLLFALCFSVCGFVAGCSDSGGSGKKSAVTIEADGTAVNSLTLGSNEQVNLKAVLKDKNGNPVSDYTTNWSCTEGLGTFSVNGSSQTAETVFTALNGSFSGTNVRITADCNGVKKSIRVQVEEVVVAISFQGGNSVANGQTKQFKATVTRSGQEVTTLPITWSTSPAGAGSFSGATYSGEYVTYTAPASGTGSIQIKATVGGTTTTLGLPINITA